jgi:hypothetical protein
MIVYALGYKIEFPDDIRERCDDVVLDVLSRGKRLSIRRNIKRPFDIVIENENVVLAEFISEREYSRFLFDAWGFGDPVVTNSGSKATNLYVSQLLPLFYLEQDRGYTCEYYIPTKFVRDQYAEVVRLVHGLLPKNSFDKKRLRFELKEKIEYSDRVVLRIEKQIAELISEVGLPRRPVEEVEVEFNLAVEALELLRESGGIANGADSEMASRISGMQLRRRDILRERSVLETRVRGFHQIEHEIEVESNTLSLNEEARRVFAEFDAICANEGCGLFARSSSSYGKSLLYLKDQIKDIRRVRSGCSRLVEELNDQLVSIEAEIHAASARRVLLAESSPVAALVEAVSDATERVIRLRKIRHLEGELARLDADYVSELNERGVLQTSLENLHGHATIADLDVLKVRRAMSERTRFWIEVLNTANVSRDVEVDADFNVQFGGQKVVKFHGSTLTRVVLAIRTAAFEVASETSAFSPKFFILDTPRQQDISRDDLARYIEQLKIVASSRKVQIVFSTTNHRYDVSAGDEDAEWVPNFPGEKHEMFLGIV